VLLVTVGAGLILAGVLVIAIPLYQVWRRGQADSEALKAWNSGGSQALIGAAPDSGSHPAGPACHAASAPANDYALVSFPSLPQYGYAQVAGNGTWDMLTQRSMVHYQTSTAPGQPGNVIIAFHREAEFQHIDELKPGDTVDIQDRTCKVWHYRVTQRWTLDPDHVTQLNATSGRELTLITCTPWYVDTQRIVWRAELDPSQ
jgi:LPXTG-site transpeptidase (sortase) family protein